MLDLLFPENRPISPDIVEDFFGWFDGGCERWWEKERESQLKQLLAKAGIEVEGLEGDSFAFSIGGKRIVAPI